MRTTIRHVAEATGVSAMAVSSVLNGSGSNVKVSGETAKRIRQAARELRYRPNSLARNLRNRKTQTIGVVFQHFERLAAENPYYPQLLNGVMAALFPAGYTLALCPRLMSADDASSVSDGRFDGVLWCRPELTEASVSTLQDAVVPVVMMHSPPGTVPGVSTFCADNDRAMLTAVRHLGQLGHKRLAYVVDKISEPTVEAQTRRDAFLSAASAEGLKGEVLVWEEDCREIASYKSDDRPHTGLVCFGDTLAGQLLLACSRNGISVPRDLSVIGFDSSSFCEGTRPRLTSLNQPVELMAQAATQHLLSLIRNLDDGAPLPPPLTCIYDCRLDVRDSTGPAFA